MTKHLAAMLCCTYASVFDRLNGSFLANAEPVAYSSGWINLDFRLNLWSDKKTTRILVSFHLIMHVRYFTIRASNCKVSGFFHSLSIVCMG